MLIESMTSQRRPMVDRAVDELLRRARALEDRDRALVELLVGRQMTCADAGRLLGMHPGNVSRQVRRAMRRLQDPVSSALFLRGMRLPDDVRQLGFEHFVQGVRVGELATRHGMTRYRVHQVLAFLRGWAKGTRSGE